MVMLLKSSGKRLALACTVLLMMCSCLVLPDPRIEWWNEYTEGDYEGGIAVGVLPDSGICVFVFALAGSYEQNRSCRLIKYSPSGKRMWAKNYALDFFSYDLGGFIDHAGCPVLLESHTSRSRVVRFDTAGTPVWKSREFPYLVYSMAETEDGNIVLVGSDSGSVVHMMSPTGDSIWTARIDSLGAFYGVAASSRGEVVCRGVNGMVSFDSHGEVIAGLHITGFGGLCIDSHDLLAVGTDDGWMLRLRVDCTFVDSFPMPEGGWSLMTLDREDNIILARSAYGPTRYDHSSIIEVMKVDGQCREMSSAVGGNWSTANPKAVTACPDGSAVVTGWCPGGTFTLKANLH